MSLRIEVLPDLAAAERLLSEIVSARASSLTRLNLLFGSSLQRIDAQRRLAAEAGGGLAAVHGFTPVDLAQAIVDRGNAPPRRSWPRGADLVAVRELLEDVRLSAFDPDAPGLTQALLRTLTDLREAALRPEDLPEGDLRKAFAAWRERVSDVGDRTAIYEDAVSNATSVDAYREALGNAPLIVSGITDLTRIQRLLIRRCAEAAAVRILMVDPARAGNDTSIPIRTTQLLTGESNAELVRHTTAATPLTESECFSTGDPIAEAEEVARRILELARGGIPFHRVAVLHQQGAPADERIRAALVRAGVPVWPIAGESVARSAPGRAARDLLRLLLTDGERVERSALIDALAQPGLANPLPLGVDDMTRQPQQWERAASAAALVRGWPSMRARLAHWLDSDDTESDTGQGLLTVIDDLTARSEQLQQARTWGEAADLLMQALDTYLAPASEQADDEKQACRRLSIEAVDRLRQLDDHSLTYVPSAALSAALRALNGVVVRDRKRLIGGANVGPANGPARGIRYDAVFVAGCAERVFPAPGRQDPLLPDEVRAQINRRVPGALALQSERAVSDRLVFQLLRQAARARFTVSWARRSSAIGGPARASSLLLESASVSPGDTDRLAVLESEEDLAQQARLLRIPSAISGVSPTAEQVERSDWSSVLRALDPDDLRIAFLTAPGVRRAALLSEFWPQAEPALRAIHERNAPRFTEFDGRLTMPSDWDPTAREWSPRSLELYVRCPYRFFLRHIIELKSVAEPPETSSPIVAGQLVVRILRRWLSRWLQEVPGETRPPWLEFTSDERRLDAVADEVLPDAAARGLLGPPATAEQTAEALRNDLSRIRRLELTDARDGWTPVESQTSYEGAKLSIGAGRSVQLSGQIERIDRHKDGRLRAVRYTVGAMDPGVEGFRNGSVLNPVADLAALMPHLRERDTGIAAGESMLRSVSARGEFASQTLRGADFARRGGDSAPTSADDLIDTFGTIVNGIEAGSFIANVGEPTERRPHCRRCPYEAACTPDIAGRTAFKANREPERVRALAALRRKRVLQ